MTKYNYNNFQRITACLLSERERHMPDTMPSREEKERKHSIFVVAIILIGVVIAIIGCVLIGDARIAFGVILVAVGFRLII